MLDFLDAAAMIVGYSVIVLGTVATVLLVIALLLMAVQRAASKALFQAYCEELVMRVARAMKDETFLAKFALPKKKPRSNRSLDAQYPSEEEHASQTTLPSDDLL